MWSKSNITISVWGTQASDLCEISSLHTKSQTLKDRTLPCHISPQRLTNQSMSHQSKTHREQNPAWNTYLISWSVSGLKGCPSDKLQAQESSFISHRSRELKEILWSPLQIIFYLVFLKLKPMEWDWILCWCYGAYQWPLTFSAIPWF